MTMVPNQGNISLRGMRPPKWGHEMTALKNFKKFFIVQGLASTYRYTLTTEEIGWWLDLKKGNGMKKCWEPLAVCYNDECTLTIDQSGLVT